MSNAIHLGPFQLIEPITKGTMGELWRGVHLEQEVPVAVKVLAPVAARDAQCRDDFRNEMRHVAAMDHPGIITIFDYGVIDRTASRASDGSLLEGAPYKVMELAELGSLTSVKRPFRWNEIYGVLVALLDALAHAHARGVVHRDLKPQNVLLVTRSALKLSDFGIAHALDVHTRSGTLHRVSGSVQYMAPEQILGHWRDYGPWTDLYGLGCLAYKLATGATPFHAHKGKAALRAHMREEVPPLQSRVPVPEGFEAWTRRLMNKDRRARFVRAADAAWALGELGENMEDEATEEAVTIPTLAEAGATTTSLVFRRRRDAGAEPANAAPSTSDLAPAPASWRRHATPRPSPQLVGAGQGLFGLRTIPLVAREPERDLIWDIFQEVGHQRASRCVVLQGAAGTGKSRLMRWICERAHEVGAAEILIGAQGPQAPDGGGIAHMLSSYLKCHRLPRMDVRDRVEEFLSSRGVHDAVEVDALTDMIHPAEGDDRVLTSANRRYTAARRFLAQVARDRPVIVALDDVHWGHDALGLVIDVMTAERSAQVPILFILTAREEALAIQSDEVARLRTVMALPESTTVQVDALSSSDAFQLVQVILGLEDAQAEKVVERTLGNPQFAVALVGDWVERGVLEMGPEGFRLASGDSAPIPDTVHDVWRSRLVRAMLGLPVESHTCLWLAACLGHDVDEREWQELCDLALAGGDMDLVETSGQVIFSPQQARIRAHLVSRLLDQGLAVETELGWSFAHAMVRESLCRTCREKGLWEKQQLSCARMLERRASRGLRGAGERVGLHLVAAGRGDEAIRHLMRGVQDRQVQRGYRSALSLLATCEATMNEARLVAEDARWGTLWNLRSRLFFHHGDLGESEFWAERAAHAAGQHGWHPVYRQGLFQMAQVSLRRSDLSRAEARLMTLKAAATEGEEDALMLGKAMFGLAAVARSRQQFDRAYKAYGEARGHFVKCGELMLAASCWRDMAAVELKCGDVVPAGDLYGKALTLFESTGNLHDVAYCVNGLGEVARALGDPEAAERHYRRALATFEAVGASQINIPRLNIALLLLDRQEYAKARELCAIAVRELERQGRRRLLGAAYMVMVPCDAGLGDWEAWEVHFDAASQLLRETGFAEPDCALCARRGGDIASRAGDKARAKRAYEFSLYQYLALGDKAGTDEVQLLVHRYD